MRSIVALLVITTFTFAAEPLPRKWKVGDVERTGLLYAPVSAKEKPTPVVFVFHGHGGSSKNALRQFAMDKQWPEAISVYLQGLNTPGRLTDPDGKKPGWQHSPGDQGDRDLKFFDEVLKSLKTDYTVDDQRIYSTGHSNGGGFTYLLWGQRGDLFAALAPSAAVANPAKFGQFQPKPVFHLGGEDDPLVKFEWQKAGIEQLKKINGVNLEAKAWGDNKNSKIYESKSGTPVVTHITPDGKHSFPKDGPALIVKFFKEHAKK